MNGGQSSALLEMSIRSRFGTAVVGPRAVWAIATIVAIALSTLPLIVLIARASHLTIDPLGLPSQYRDGLIQIGIRSVGVALITCLIAMPCAIVLARLASRWAQGIIIGLLLIPFFVSPPLRAFAWSRLLAADALIADGFRVVGVIRSHCDGIRFTEASLWFVLIVMVFPFAILPMLPLVPQRGSSSWRTAVELDGMRSIAVLRFGLPTMLPGAAIGFLWCVVMCVYASDEEQYLGHSISFRKLMESAIERDSQHGWETAFSLAVLIATALLSIAVAFVIVRSRVSRALRWMSDHAVALAAWSSGIPLFRSLYLRRSIDRTLGTGAAGLLGAMLAFGLLPVLWTIGASITSEEGRTLSRYADLRDTPQLWRALWNSLFLGGLTAASALVIAWAIASSVFWGRKTALALVILLWCGALLPAEIFSLGVFEGARAIGVEPDGGVTWILLSHVAWALPFVTTILMIHNGGVPRTSILAAIELDGRPKTVWRRTLLPMSVPALASCFLMGLLLSMNESTRNEYLRGRVDLLSNQVYGKLNSGIVGGSGGVLAISAMIVLATAVAVIASALLFVLAVARPTRPGVSDGGSEGLAASL